MKISIATLLGGKNSASSCVLNCLILPWLSTVLSEEEQCSNIIWKSCIDKSVLVSNVWVKQLFSFAYFVHWALQRVEVFCPDVFIWIFKK